MGRLMRTERVLDRAAFFPAARAFFARDEARATIALTIVASLEGRAEIPSDVETWRVDDGGVPVAYAVRTPPFPFVVALGTPAAMEDLARARAAAESAGTVGALPAVGGPEELSLAFARAFAERTGRPVRAEKRMRLYLLDAVIPPARPAPGTFRRAGPHDLEVLSAFYDAFARDVDMPLRAAREVVAEGISGGRIYVWEDAGAIVSMAQRAPRVGSIVRVNLVYTPPAARGRGYASHTVAALTSLVLEEGAQACLFTDLANPTSNAIYQAIGYCPVADYRELRFG